jgi:chemotaxis protein MotB
LQEKPDISEASKHIMVEETKQEHNIEDGRSMFPEGGKEPYPRTRKLPWELSAHRPNAVRQILMAEGRRVTITLVREEPPLPTDFQP